MFGETVKKAAEKDNRFFKIGNILAVIYFAIQIILYQRYQAKLVLFSLSPGFTNAVLVIIWVSVVYRRHYKQNDHQGLHPIWLTGFLLVGLLVIGFNKIMSPRSAMQYFDEGTEPQTGRTFVVESHQYMLGKGNAKLYERKGIFIFPCDVESYSGDISGSGNSVYIDEERNEIVIAFFEYDPVFYVPLKD